MGYNYYPIPLFCGIYRTYSSFLILRLTNKFFKLTNLKLNLWWVWLKGRASVCGPGGCRFKSYHPPLNNNIIFFLKKNKIKKKTAKKQTILINRFIFFKRLVGYNYNNFYFYFIYLNTFKSFKSAFGRNQKRLTSLSISISQKKYNPKCSFKIENNLLNTFSVGSIMRYFNIMRGKHVRRSIKGSKIFLNFLKNVFEKKYSKATTTHFFFQISGTDFNLIFLRSQLKSFLKVGHSMTTYFLHNIKISFTTTKDKKVKAIKKRLKKKILLNFLKKSNF